MPTKLALALPLLLALRSSELAAGQAPIYKLIYSAPDPSSQGAVPVALFETSPSVFDFLAAQGGQTFGPSIFSLTTAVPPA